MMELMTLSLENIQRRNLTPIEEARSYKNLLDKGYTQEQLAELLNISPRHLQRIEQDETKTTLKMLKKIKSILDIPDSEMIKIFK